jgi:2-C-methyl-D-erythritol 4-phosphate cytidylyltransferase
VVAVPDRARPEVAVLAPLAGRPLLARAVAALEASRPVAAIVVVTDPEALGATAELVAGEGHAKPVEVIAGGPTRRAAVAAALAALPPGLAFAAVHDACRPLAAAGEVDRLLGLLLERPDAAGVVPALPVTDTIRRVAGDRSEGVVDREGLRAPQTPQLFLRAALEDAHRRAGAEPDGDALLLERAGYRVVLVPGAADNIEVTTSLDLLVAEALLRERRP